MVQGLIPKKPFHDSIRPVTPRELADFLASETQRLRVRVFTADGRQYEVDRARAFGEGEPHTIGVYAKEIQEPPRRRSPEYNIPLMEWYLQPGRSNDQKERSRIESWCNDDYPFALTIYQDLQDEIERLWPAEGKPVQPAASDSVPQIVNYGTIGIVMQAQGDNTVGGDVVGRDKTTNQVIE